MLFFKESLKTPSVSSDGAVHFDNIKKHAEIDFSIVNLYYKDRETNVRNHNFFVRLIKQLLSDVTQEETSYLEEVDRQLRSIVRMFKITSEYSKGEPILSLFGDTVMLFEKSFLNPFDVTEDINVMKCVYSSSTDLGMNHPSKIENGHYMFMLDIRALMIQYKRWSLERLEVGDHNLPTLFVYQVLYTNVIKDLFDFALVNRFFDAMGEIEDSDPKHPFHIRDYDKRVDKAFDDLFEKLAFTNRYYTEVFSWIPTCFSDNALTLLKRPVYDDNNNTKIFTYLSNSIILNDAIFLLSENGFKKNRDIITAYKYFFRDLVKNKYIEHFNFKDSKLYILTESLVNDTKLITGE